MALAAAHRDSRDMNGWHLMAGLTQRGCADKLPADMAPLASQACVVADKGERGVICPGGFPPQGCVAVAAAGCYAGHMPDGNLMAALALGLHRLIRAADMAVAAGERCVPAGHQEVGVLLMTRIALADRHDFGLAWLGVDKA